VLQPTLSHKWQSSAEVRRRVPRYNYCSKAAQPAASKNFIKAWTQPTRCSADSFSVTNSPLLARLSGLGSVPSTSIPSTVPQLCDVHPGRLQDQPQDDHKQACAEYYETPN
jgi:hypothetical protein